MANCIRRTVPNDNDCLFSSVSQLMDEQGRLRSGAAMELRRYVASVIAADPELYAEWRLGMSNADYCKWIVNPHNWGGETEIVILSERFKVEIGIVSCESFTAIVYGEGSPGYTGRIHLLYTGQHYDPLVGGASPDTLATSEQRIFPIGGAAVFESLAIEAARVAAAEAEKKKKEKKKKCLKCGGCGALFDDTETFQVHCMEVEHDEDFMYDCEEVEVVLAADEAPAEGTLDLSSPDVESFYNNEQAPFSNLYPASITATDGKLYASAEHYWLASRFFGTNDPLAEAVRVAATASDADNAANFGEGCDKVRPDWDPPAGGEGGVREVELREAIRLKFEQHEGLKQALIGSSSKTLVLLDINTFLGVDASGGIPKGKNTLGRLLMELRDSFK